MNLHPYDNGTRCFRDDDRAPADGLAIVARLLRLAGPPPAGVRYDLSFYSGGMGIIDQLAIALPPDDGRLPSIISALAVRTPVEAAADPDWHDDFVWLVGDEAEQDIELDHAALRAAAARFIVEHRRDFQPTCGADDPMWFEDGSGVNHWVALWVRDGRLSYLGFDQG